MSNYFNIAWVGAGNVSWHLAPAIENAGHRISLVYNRSKQNRKSLIDRLYNARSSNDLDFSEYPLDFVIICVSDNAISEVLSDLIVPDQCIVVHMSGGVSMEIMEIVANDHFGVLYPLQTFTAGMKTELNKVPFFIEGSNEYVLDRLKDLSKSISRIVYHLDSKSRMKLHLAAVIGSNFTNHLISIAKNILDECDLDYKVLYPLVSEAINKAFNIDPLEAQTGPARRADYEVIDMHLELLKNSEDIAGIYQVITSNILKTYHSVDRASDT